MFYTCVCRSGVHITEDVRNTSWSSLELITPPVHGAYYAMRLMLDGGECITREFILDKPIVSSFGLPDTVYSASSSWDGNSLPYNARFGAYTVSCAWLAHINDGQPWLAITLPTEDYIISGVIIKKRFTNPAQYVKRVTISTSVDGVAWQDVIVDEVYDDIVSGVRFSVVFTTRYWKIFVKAFGTTTAAMKCDLSGVKLWFSLRTIFVKLIDRMRWSEWSGENIYRKSISFSMMCDMTWHVEQYTK